MVGQRVALVTDPTQDTTDPYGRTLAYLVLPVAENADDGVTVNADGNRAVSGSAVGVVTAWSLMVTV
jgi:hypothetical protein